MALLTQSTRLPFRLTLMVIGLSVLIRLLVLFLVRHVPFASDAQDYLGMAHQLLSGPAFVPYWPPGLPLYLELFVALGGGEPILRASMLVFWLLACWGCYRLMKALGLAHVAWLVLLVFSMLPDCIQLSIEPLTQLPVAAMFILALSSAVRLLRGAHAAEYLLLGLSLTFLSLVRPSGILLLLFLPLFCAVTLRRYLPAFATVILGCALIGLWMSFVHGMIGRWVLNTANSKNMYLGNNPWTPNYRTWYFGSHAKLGSDEIKRYPEYRQTLEHVEILDPIDASTAYQRLTSAQIKAHFGLFLYRTLNRTRCFFGFDTFTGAALQGVMWRGIFVSRIVLLCEAAVYLLLAGPAFYWIAGAAWPFWKNAVNLAILGSIVLYAAPYWMSMSHPTYHFPVLLPLAVLGAQAWNCSNMEKRKERLRGWAAIGVLLLVQVEWVWRMSGRVF